MTPSNAHNILLRGARITKRGKHVVSYNTAMGVVLQGAAALALGGALSTALPQAALASQCGPLSGGENGGEVTCDVTTYTGDGVGTADTPGTTPISYSGTWTQDTTITIDELFLTTGGRAVFLETGRDSQRAVLDENGAPVLDEDNKPVFEGITSSIIVNGGEINQTDLTNNHRGVYILDRARTSAGAVIVLNDDVRIITAGRSAMGALVISQDVTDPTGGASVTLNGNAQIMTSGRGARGAYVQQQERTIDGGGARGC